MQPKVIVSTDIGGNDKDDAQSFIHALLYADTVDYRGFIATSSDANGVDGISPMRKIINAYEKDLPNLRTAGDYPDAAALRGLIKQGATEGDWPGPLSDGARLIINEARKASPNDPVYLLTWGPVHDVARALFEAPDIVENVRVYSIYGYGQDSRNPDAFQWMRQAVRTDEDYRDLWWIDAAETFRGMYAGNNGENDPSAHLNWVKNNVDGHGALGDLFYSDYTFDLYGRGTPDGLKMGDTPSLLYLLDDISNDNPALRSWGGSFQRDSIGPNVWVDRDGENLGRYDGARTVSQHRDEVWGDFAARLDIAKNGAPGGTPTPPPILTPAPEDQGPAPAPAPVDPDPTPDVPSAPVVEDSPVLDPRQEFSTFGTNGADTLKGGGQADRIYGAGGNDLILGRGSNDLLAGGSGNDTVKGGAGNDTLVYTASDNAGNRDIYLGSSGYDTLRVQLTAAEFASSTVQSQLASLESFIARNYDLSVNGGSQFTLNAFGLTVGSIENVEIVLTDGSSPSVPAPVTPAPTPPVIPIDPPVEDSGPSQPAPVTQPDPIDVANLPVFSDSGTSSANKLAGQTGSDSYTGAGGNDLVLGRGGNDVLAGGAGNDVVKGGAGNDRLIYIADDNAGARDAYQGSRGSDVLEIYVSRGAVNEDALADDIAAFRTFAEDNRDLARDGGPSFQFTVFDLEVQSVEQVDVFLFDSA